MECTKCGACCVAPDITALAKPLGVPCPHLVAAPGNGAGLVDGHFCSIYDTRPDVCRGYQPDELCLEIAAPTLAERVVKYLAKFDL